MRLLKYITMSVLFTAAYFLLAAQARETRPAAPVIRWAAPGWSMFREASYDPATEVLWVRFASGHEYVYRGVPGACSAAFFEAQDKGMFFNRNIRRCYASKRLDLPASPTPAAAVQSSNAPVAKASPHLLPEQRMARVASLGTVATPSPVNPVSRAGRLACKREP